MVLTEGTNAGFVTATPSGDPAVGTPIVDDFAFAGKFVSPKWAGRVTEIGWWCEDATQEADFEVGIYTHNIIDDEPETLIAKSAPTAKGTTGGEWKRVTGLNIFITENTTYWIAVQLDNTASTTDSGWREAIGHKTARISGATSLPSPWGTSDNTEAFLVSFYAIWEVAELIGPFPTHLRM